MKKSNTINVNLGPYSLYKFPKGNLNTIQQKKLHKIVCNTIKVFLGNKCNELVSNSVGLFLTEVEEKRMREFITSTKVWNELGVTF